MESKFFWILIILALPVVLFLTMDFVVAPLVYSEEGLLHPFFVKYIEGPAKSIGLTEGEIGNYFGHYIFDFYVIIFAIILIVLTDVKFSDFGFDFSEFKKDIVIGVLFFAVDFALLIGVILFSAAYIPSYITEFSLSGAPVEVPEGSLEGITEKPVFTPKFIILNFILFFFFVAPAEEIFRLFTYIKLGNVAGGVVAFFLSAFIFGAMHLFGSGFQSINAFVGGLALNALWLFRGKKILAPIIAHGFYDLMLLFI